MHHLTYIVGAAAVVLVAIISEAGAQPAPPSPLPSAGPVAGEAETLLPLARRGDADAQFRLGKAYRSRKGIGQDLVAAFASGWRNRRHKAT